MAEAGGVIQRPLDVNRYATKKTIAQGMLDIALLTANASQLKYVLQTNGKHPFYTLMLSLISVSIILQVVSGLVSLTFTMYEDCRLKKLTKFDWALVANQFTLTMSFIVTGVNVIIVVFDPTIVMPSDVTVGISILYIGTLNINKEKHCSRANLLNNLITIQIFIISAVNVIISAFGIEQVNLYQARQDQVRAQGLHSSNQSLMIFDETKI